MDSDRSASGPGDRAAAAADASRHALVLRLARPLIVLAGVVAAFAWTWSYCPDPVIDFGRELYVPWRISEGDVLYRDLNYFNGPFSPYFNAILFEIFGVSMRTLKLANALIAIGVALLLYRLVREISDCLSSVIAGIVFAGAFAGAQYGPGANFNYLTPYSHDLTHGFALALAMIACLWRADRSRKAGWLCAAGLCLGLVLLTKVEIALAAIVAAVASLGMLLIRVRGRGLLLIAFLAGAIVPPVVAVILLAQAMPLRDAIVNAAGSWVWLGDERISTLPFFRWVMGTDLLELNIIKMVGWIGRYALLLVSSAVLAILLKRERGSRRAPLWAAVIAVGVALPMAWWWNAIPWKGVLRPLPLFLLIIGCVCVMQWLRARPDARPRLALSATLAAFSLALLIKIFFNVHVYHYGFVLALPGTMLLVACLVGWIPGWVDRLGGLGHAVRAASLAAIAVMIGVHLGITNLSIAARSNAVGRGPDRFFSEHRGALVNLALEDLEKLRAPGDTLVAMPEGAMLNYLLRMPSTSRYQNFLPSEMMMYTERAMLEELHRRPPTFIAIVHRTAPEYEAPEFGEDYARAIAAWVLREYVAVGEYGVTPFTSEQFGILLMRHKDSSTPATQPSE